MIHRRQRENYILTVSPERSSLVSSTRIKYNTVHTWLSRATLSTCMRSYQYYEENYCSRMRIVSVGDGMFTVYT